MFQRFYRNCESAQFYESSHGMKYIENLEKNLCHPRCPVVFTTSYTGSAAGEACANMVQELTQDFISGIPCFMRH